ncbi:hypothetical protein CSOJ01_08797 [Colletotrichum sojae]|uniref:Uncharacterized protein n=1 Tax=Colletotrichum sojae TaxID=2175907 RepID=A0A8H6J4Q2_9PEZI|nr:hypothetical protein CSOJ01_08797 [Colletotrichum sojae]
MRFTDIIVSGYVVFVYGAPITSDLLGTRDEDDRRHCVSAAPMIQVNPGVAPAVEVAPAVWPHVELDDRDINDDVDNLEVWPSVQLENRDLDNLEQDIGEMEDAEELEDRDVGVIEATDKHHKHIRCPTPAVWNASLRKCVAPAAPAAVATCVSPMIYDVMTEQCVHPAATASVPQCVAPIVYDTASRMCVRPATASPAPQCAAPLVYNPVTRQCTIPTAAPVPAPAPAPSPVLQCVAPLIYNPNMRDARRVSGPGSGSITGTATALAKPSCALRKMAYCAKTSTNYVAYDAAIPLCHSDGVNMVFCAAPARFMAMLQVKTFDGANATAGDPGL